MLLVTVAATALADADGDGICDVTFDGQVIDEDPESTCDGTFDKVGVCNGTCILDADFDGLCDEHVDGSTPEDPCIGLASNYQTNAANVAAQEFRTENVIALDSSKMMH